MHSGETQEGQQDVVRPLRAREDPFGRRMLLHGVIVIACAQ